MSRAEANHRSTRLVAVVAGLLGAVLALSIPFLPVTQTTGSPRRPELKHEINTALERIKRNGTYDRINSRFLPFRVS